MRSCIWRVRCGTMPSIRSISISWPRSDASVFLPGPATRVVHDAIRCAKQEPVEPASAHREVRMGKKRQRNLDFHPLRPAFEPTIRMFFTVSQGLRRPPGVT